MRALTDSSGSHFVEPSDFSDGSLDQTRLLDGPGEKWRATLYPQAGEATVLRHLRSEPPPPGSPPPTDPDRRQLLDVQHAKAAQARIRRYCRANRTAFLWTGTFAVSVRTLKETGEAWDAFARRLREKLGRFPWLAVFEPHPGGHGYHVHWTTDRFLSIELIRKLWEVGHVHVSEGAKTNKRGNSPRKVAKYLAKYVSKSLDQAAKLDQDGEQLEAGQLAEKVEGRARGEHRYRVAQGFAPQKVTRYFRTPDRARLWLRWYYGEPIEEVPLCFSQPDEIDGWWFDYPDRLQHPPPMAGAEAVA